MGKVKEEIQNLIETCQRKYEEGGSAAVIEYIEEAIRQGDNPIMLDVRYERCEACDADMPSIDHECLVCGQSTTPKLDKQQLVDAVIEDLKKGFELGDYTVLDELLNMLPVKKLVQALPEEEWEKYKDLNNSYFELMHQDFNEDLDREEIQIHCGENGNLMIAKTPEGFVIDVYGQNDLIDTMAIWEDTLTSLPDEDDELDNADITDEDIVQFKKDWGQTHSGVTAELGYPRSHEESDGLLMDDYFWIEKDKRWYNKCASGFTEKEQRIADYLRNLN